jgi:hypothetical protein
MVILTFIIIGGVLLLVAGLYVVAGYMSEVENGFVYFAWGMVALLICVAVYLSYAVPSFAQYKLPAASKTTAVTQAAVQGSAQTTDETTPQAAVEQKPEMEINLLQE